MDRLLGQGLEQDQYPLLHLQHEDQEEQEDLGLDQQVEEPELDQQLQELGLEQQVEELDPDQQLRDRGLEQQPEEVQYSHLEEVADQALEAGSVADCFELAEAIAGLVMEDYQWQKC